MVTTANLRMVCKVASSRSRNVTASGVQGSISVPVKMSSVRIVRASRFSDAIGKCLLTSATVLFQTTSKSPAGIRNGFDRGAAGVKTWVKLGRLHADGPDAHPN